jgi:hypothetical protein
MNPEELLNAARTSGLDVLFENGDLVVRGKRGLVTLSGVPDHSRP